MTHQSDHLAKLICAARTARDYGFVHTGRALDRMALAEQQRLQRVFRRDSLPAAGKKPSNGYAPEDT